MPETLIRKRYGAYLPHWTKCNAIYAVTFRLADSLPQEKLDEIRFERMEILDHAQRQNRALTREERKTLHELGSERINAFLRQGHGSCWLARGEMTELMANALKYFDGNRYRLFAWCIMPNHVHVVVQPLEGHELSAIVHSWKSFAAKEANRRLNLSGAFWQVEYYDHLIRNIDDLQRSIEYVWENSEAAHLQNWKWRWKAKIVE